MRRGYSGTCKTQSNYGARHLEGALSSLVRTLSIVMVNGIVFGATWNVQYHELMDQCVSGSAVITKD